MNNDNFSPLEKVSIYVILNNLIDTTENPPSQEYLDIKNIYNRLGISDDVLSLAEHISITTIFDTLKYMSNDKKRKVLQVLKNPKEDNNISEAIQNLHNLLIYYPDNNRDIVSHIFKTCIIPEIHSISHHFDTYNHMNEYFDKNFNGGAIYSDDRKLLGVFPTISYYQDGTLDIKSDSRDAKYIFFYRGSDLSKSIQVTAHLRISDAIIRSYGKSDSFSEYVRFLSPRHFALNLNGRVFTGIFNMTSGKTMFKLYSPMSVQHTELMIKHQDVIEQLPLYNSH